MDPGRRLRLRRFGAFGRDFQIPLFLDFRNLDGRLRFELNLPSLKLLFLLGQHQFNLAFALGCTLGALLYAWLSVLCLWVPPALLIGALLMRKALAEADMQR